MDFSNFNGTSFGDYVAPFDSVYSHQSESSQISQLPDLPYKTYWSIVLRGVEDPSPIFDEMRQSAWFFREMSDKQLRTFLNKAYRWEIPKPYREKWR